MYFEVIYFMQSQVTLMLDRLVIVFFWFYKCTCRVITFRDKYCRIKYFSQNLFHIISFTYTKEFFAETFFRRSQLQFFLKNYYFHRMFFSTETDNPPPMVRSVQDCWTIMTLSSTGCNKLLGSMVDHWTLRVRGLRFNP